MGAEAISSSNSAATMPEMEKDLKIPRHIAVIIDGNRRYGKNKYGSGTRGHSDGTKTVMNFTDWCIDAGVEALTVFAFSTENWKREKAEIDALMKLVDGFIHDILGEALTRNIRVRVLVSDSRKLPAFLVKSIQEVEAKTQQCNVFHLNLCVRQAPVYGARDEIVGACKKIATEVAQGETSIDDIDENLLGQRMLTAGLPDPDIMLRTSGELRISNFLLFQIAYAELIFMDKFWPEVTREDLQDIIVEFNRRKRRFGK
ncbi:undecaprenyl pyrophosphate synthetase, putative [Phytophthora infestans T30-4]|uniref:Alkyl transferase n=1 Tax=Phytophthora infestans (strain T30-4) TaxID=403677 RepID=D0N423_PHYIT|nr:undecaprenyl pyrophosphate synthetase, putative [Phytophthora infestans T30-4]EEY69127.1 undecaprenyl pyrophosphate synthetase, putative [Phytophthora infestans T30-4]|eukprot:XP_002998981.1 undecaprenyl pyrophosphate synthetase, putative [Phytophthora infestans T30-4]